MAPEWDYRPESHSDESEASTPLPAFARDPLGILRRRWMWMALAFLVCVAATGGLVSLRQSTYVASTTILVSSQAIPEEFVRSTVVEDSLQHINAIVGQVLARRHLAELIEKYHLYPEERDEVPLSAIVDDMRPDIEIYPQESLSHTRAGPSSQIFVIAFEYPEPELAADIANELAGFFTAANIAMRNRQAQLTTDFLRRELNRAEEELREQESKITSFMQQHRGGLPGELDANLAKLERLQAQRQSLATQIDAGEGRLMLLHQQPELSLDEGPTPRTLLGDLKGRLEEQLVILTEEHPNVIALRRRIERLESDIEEEEQVKRATGPSVRQLALASEEHQLSGLRGQVKTIEARIILLDEHVAQTPMRQEEFSALEQRATVLRENYLGFLRKVQEAQLAQSLESAQHGARISVLDRATPPSVEKHPRWKLIGAGLAAAIALSLLLAILLELLDAVVVSTSHLESLTKQPLLGSVPRVA